jgi:hypothetical protein
MPLRGLRNQNDCADFQFKVEWRRCMEVEPTLDQKAGRATVLKTAGELIQGASAYSSLCPRTAFPDGQCAHCSRATQDCTRFGVESGIKTAAALLSVGP